MLRIFHPSNIPRLFKHKSLQNLFFLFSIQFSNVLINLVSIPLLIQAVGVDQFGLVNLALSVIFLANVFVNFGYNLSGPREVAVNQGDVHVMSSVVSKVFFGKLLLASLTCLVIIAAMFLAGFFSEHRVILFFSLLLLFSEATSSTWFFQGFERMRMVSIANLLTRLLYLLALVLFINYPEDAKWANFYLGAIALMANLLLLYFIQSQLKIKIYFPRLAEIVRSWRENYSLFLSGLATHLSVNGGLILLSFFASATILGMYSMAEKVSMVMRMVPTLITQAVYPNASKLFQSDVKLFFRFLKKVYWAALILSMLITALVIAFAPQIIWLISKENFESSISFLRILSMVPFFASFNIANMIIILVSDEKEVLFQSTVISCGYMLIASPIFIYFFGGMGLAFSLLSTEFITFIVSSVFISRKQPQVFNGYYRSAFRGNYIG